MKLKDIVLSRNSQTIRFAYTVDEAKGLEIFKTLNLGGGINEKATENEAPTGYILICEEDKNTVPLHLFSFNMGCICQNINLFAMNGLQSLYGRLIR